MKILIDIITLSFIILNLIYIPIELSFSIQSEDYLALHVATNHFTLIMFLFEIICHLNTGKQTFVLYQSIIYLLSNIDLSILSIFLILIAIYVNGLIISDRKEIIKNYFKKMFWQFQCLVILISLFKQNYFHLKRWDLLIIIPLCAGIYFDIIVLKLIIVLRFFDILNLVQDIEDRFQFKDRFRGQLQLFKLMAFILCLAHLIACTWNKLADIQFSYGYTQTWVGNIEQGSNLQFLKQYIRSIYWTVVTMTTLGYGDITPKTAIEQVFATSIGLLSTVVFAFSVSMIGEILKDISKKQSEFRSKMSTIEAYMNRRKLNQQLQVKVRKYFDYLHKEEQEDTNEAASLKEEVFVDMYGRLLKSKKIFDLHFSQPFLNQLALKMKEMRLGPEEIIYRENEPGNKIYFILKGEIQMLLNMKQESQQYHMLCNLKEGQIFGEVEFFSGLVRENTARTLNVTSLVYVEYDDFIETVKAFPEDYEQVLQTKDNINLYNKSKGLDHKCFSCQSFDHRLKSCPLVNYIPNRTKIMYNFNLYQDQMRSDVSTRKDFRAVKTLKQIKYLKQSAMRLHFYIYNEQLLNEEELSQLDFDVESDDNLCNQSNSFVYQQSPQIAADKYSQAGQDIPKGFMLNNSFIGAETPKHSSKLARISTMLLKGNTHNNFYGRSNTHKFINGLPLSEPDSNGIKKCDSKSKFYRQTQHISQIPSAKENSFQTENPNQENLVQDLQFSDSKYIQIHPLQLSSQFSNTPDRNIEEPTNNDDFNNINEKQFQNLSSIEQIETNADALKSDVFKSTNQINIENSQQKHNKNINFEKIKPNVQCITFQKLISNDYGVQNKDIDSPDQYKSTYLNQPFKTKYALFNKKNQSNQDQSFKNAIQNQLKKEDFKITSLEEILSLTHTPKCLNPNKQSNDITIKYDNTAEICNQEKDQQNSQMKYQQNLSLPNQCEEQKEYAKPPLALRNQLQNLKQNQNQNEAQLSTHLNNDQQIYSSSQPQFNFKVQVKSPESPPPAQERMKRKKKRSKKQSQQLHNIQSPISLKLLKVPITTSTNIEFQNNSETTNYGENLTTQLTNDKATSAQEGTSQNRINPSLNESNINSILNTNNRILRPSLFINSSLIIDVDKIQNQVYSQNSRVDNDSSDESESSDSSDSDSSSSYRIQESFGDVSNREKKENNKTLINNDLSHVHSVYSEKPQINIIRDEEVIISDYKQFKRNIKGSTNNNAIAGDSNFLGSDIKRFEIETKRAKCQYTSQFQNQGHETPQFESIKNQLQKQFKFSNSSNNLDNKKISNSFQLEHEKCNQTNKQFRINLNCASSSPKNSSKQGLEQTPSQNLQDMKSSPCLPSDFNNIQQQMKMFSQIQQKQNNNEYSNSNTPTGLIKSNTKVFDLNSKKVQTVANRIFHIKRTETGTTNNSPMNAPMLVMGNQKISSELLIPAEPYSANQVYQQNYQSANQRESSPARCVGDEFNIRVIRDSVENFDKFKIFKKYFVLNNLDVVINQINKKRNNKAIVQKIRQYNIRKKKTLIAVSKLNLKRSGAITGNNDSTHNNIKKQLTSFLQPSATLKNSTLQKIQSTQSENNQQQQIDKSQTSQQININSNILNSNILNRSDFKNTPTPTDKNNNSNINVNESKHRSSGDQIQSVLFFSDQNLLTQQNNNTNTVSGQRKRLLFANKELKSSDEKTNLIAPPIQLTSNFLSPKGYSDFNSNIISKSAGLSKKSKQLVN